MISFRGSQAFLLEVRSTLRCADTLSELSPQRRRHLYALHGLLLGDSPLPSAKVSARIAFVHLAAVCKKTRVSADQELAVPILQMLRRQR